MSYTAQQYLDAGLYCVRIEDWSMAPNPLREALRLGLDTAELRCALGKSLSFCGKYTEAREHYLRGLELNPNNIHVRFGLSENYRLLGDDTAACEMEQVAREIGVPEYRYTNDIWDYKGSLDGKKVLICTAGGYGRGDVIQYARYIKPFRDIFRCETLLLCDRDLYSIIRTVKGVGDITSEPPPIGAHDVTANLADIVLTVEKGFKVFTEVPYITANPLLKDSWRKEVDPVGLSVGVAWKASQGWMHRTKSIPVEMLKVLERPGVNIYSLQVRAGNEATYAGFKDLGSRFNNISFADAAAVTDLMDLVISIDSAVAHLAGALGKQVWTLLPMHPASRWGLNKESTPHYPTMRLFRQPAFGDWRGCLEKVREALWQEYITETPLKRSLAEEMLLVEPAMSN